ncbi:hypothetical protein M378DRAFT_174073 [Amanita muscaria Koide BX008]|uniref:Uncharacterized protein n=1 Tax=Amanita muscaria (strain Koide BX008) TaxID=946122 RepID=A0A0C2WF77_AMAMK|nr:hypothetical protein M378DRAFT_174073 [Amanita muscaria Koide BX008]
MNSTGVNIYQNMFLSRTFSNTTFSTDSSEKFWPLMIHLSSVKILSIEPHMYQLVIKQHQGLCFLP